MSWRAVLLLFILWACYVRTVTPTEVLINEGMLFVVVYLRITDIGCR